jgi:hypothetical protein
MAAINVGGGKLRSDVLLARVYNLRLRPAALNAGDVFRLDGVTENYSHG